MEHDAGMQGAGMERDTETQGAGMERATMGDGAAASARAHADDGFAAEWRRWHEAHERDRAAPHGFLAVTDLQFVDEAPRRIDGIPGEWSLEDGRVVVELDPALDPVPVLLDGAALTGRHVFAPIADRTGIELAWGERSIEVASRGGRILLRPRDPEAPLRAGYPGTPAYAPDPRWRIRGRFRPFEAPRPVTVDAALSGLSHVLSAPGEVEFEVDGEPLRLTVFGAGRGLLALFRDATSGVTTYAATRSLHIDAPTPDGEVVLDFNRAVNLPCAYTDFATCPLPPRENRLPVAVEAGERIPLERLGPAGVER